MLQIIENSAYTQQRINLGFCGNTHEVNEVAVPNNSPSTIAQASALKTQLDA